jgi:hypothetical protein
VGFRDLPDKRRLSILIPAGLDMALRSAALRERRSLSDVASAFIARGLGHQPEWDARGEARQVAEAS